MSMFNCPVCGKQNSIRFFHRKIRSSRSYHGTFDLPDRAQSDNSLPYTLRKSWSRWIEWLSKIGFIVFCKLIDVTAVSSGDVLSQYLQNRYYRELMISMYLGTRFLARCIIVYMRALLRFTG